MALGFWGRACAKLILKNKNLEARLKAANALRDAASHLEHQLIHVFGWKDYQEDLEPMLKAIETYNKTSETGESE